ncbi:GNAT family N-acetyltransferase [Caenimonas terrae]|uniref:L-ornithine N(alpha)-acyltransferase n=1 Tax=Caenimonas terrae TaxID=696074 RepID=A0ABW0NA04_9BURK
MNNEGVVATRGLSVAWARHGDEVRQAQRLRHAVFAGELGARLQTALPGHDVDRYDDFCEHLLVRDEETGEVIGTYRALTPSQARRAGSTYADSEFDLAPLAPLRSRMLELGRSCVHPQHRRGAVILALWGALAQFMAHNKLDTMIGCASIPLSPGGTAAAGVWNRLRRTHMAASPLRIAPRRPLPLPAERDLQHLDAEPPPLIQGYLRLGARVLGPPAWDPHFNSADLPLLVRLADLPPRYRRGLAAA